MADEVEFTAEALPSVATPEPEAEKLVVKPGAL